MKPGVIAGVVLLLGGLLMAYYCHTQLTSDPDWMQKGKAMFVPGEKDKQSGYKTGRVAGVVLAGAGVAVLAVSASKKGS